jgi:rRNA maturation RNase YbeY
MSEPGITITNSTKGKLPRLPFAAMKDAVLGTDYKLTFVFCTRALSRKLNRTYRNIDKPTDILSFPLAKDEGEIYIEPIESKKEAKKFEREYENFIGFLFIHGLVHLKGLDHGSTMERIERNLRARFNI